MIDLSTDPPRLLASAQIDGSDPNGVHPVPPGGGRAKVVKPHDITPKSLTANDVSGCTIYGTMEICFSRGRPYSALRG
jgi:hypothetical protein